MRSPQLHLPRLRWLRKGLRLSSLPTPKDLIITIILQQLEPPAELPTTAAVGYRRANPEEHFCHRTVMSQQWVAESTIIILRTEAVVVLEEQEEVCLGRLPP